MAVLPGDMTITWPARWQEQQHAQQAVGTACRAAARRNTLTGGTACRQFALHAQQQQGALQQAQQASSSSSRSWVHGCVGTFAYGTVHVADRPIGCAGLVWAPIWSFCGHSVSLHPAGGAGCVLSVRVCV